MSAATFLLDLIFPPTCLGCDHFGDFICHTCRESFAKLSKTICPKCLKPSIDGLKHQRCRGYIDGLISCWDYEGNMRKIIKAIKYQYYYQTLYKLTDLFLANLNLEQSISFQKCIHTQPIIVPIPLHPSRLRQRDFNQAALIAKTLSEKWQIPVSQQCLQRIKDTHYQAELTKHHRKLNVKNAFAPTKQLLNLGPKPLKNQTILLVDDVWTTGSTMQACAKVLHKLGAKQIWALTLAR